MSTATDTNNFRKQTIDVNNSENRGDSPNQRGRDLVLPRIGTGGSTAGGNKMRTLDHVQQRTAL
tara:strand:+ start:645 stop:836 length:192 start_codon:yes stop_codon:yes gene_type:complete